MITAPAKGKNKQPLRAIMPRFVTDRTECMVYPFQLTEISAV